MIGIALMATALSAAPRDKIADFPVRAETVKASVGAEFVSRAIVADTGHAVLRDYIAVEVAILPSKGASFLLSATHFTLRVNGRKSPLLTQTPGMVAASIKYDDWERRPGLVAAGGIGDAGVIIGQPRRGERFPGDPSSRTRLPAPPRAPQAEDRSGIEKPEPEKPDELVVRVALQEGETERFAAGYLYFPFKGKTASIKKVELMYSGPAGEAVLSLVP